MDRSVRFGIGIALMGIGLGLGYWFLLTDKTTGENMISREQLEEMFENIQADTEWDIDGPMLWGYFFTDDQASTLEQAARDLEAQGYRFVDIYQGEDGGPWVLHVEVEEVHSVDSLDQRNQKLSAYARKMGLASYDGMAVGPIESGDKQ